MTNLHPPQTGSQPVKPYTSIIGQTTLKDTHPALR